MSADLRLLRRAAARMRLRAWEKYGDPGATPSHKQAVAQAMFEVGYILDEICNEESAKVGASEPQGEPPLALPDPLDEVKGG